MRTMGLICTLVALIAVPQAAAQTAATRFINLVDTPVHVTYSASGQAQVVLGSGNPVLDLTGYRKVSIRIGAAKATGFMVNMGKISGTTLSQMFSGPRDSRIHTFDVVAPEMVLWLTGGPPHATDTVQLWVFLSS